MNEDKTEKYDTTETAAIFFWQDAQFIARQITNNPKIVEYIPSIKDALATINDALISLENQKASKSEAL